MTMMTEKMTSVRALTYVLTSCDLPADVAAKLTAMKEQLEKRSHSKSSKPSKQSIAAEGMRSDVLTVLGTLTDAAGASDVLLAGVSAGLLAADTSLMKVTAALTALVKAGTVQRDKVKGKMVYTLVTGEEQE